MAINWHAEVTKFSAENCGPNKRGAFVWTQRFDLII